MNPRFVAEMIPATPARLLVVEDEPDIRDICVRLLRRGGHQVVAAENGQVALDRMREASIDLVLTDIQMPKMSGMELLHELRQRYPDTDVIVFTAHTTVETAREALKEGAFDYLAKPNIVEDLERTVRRALEWRRVRIEKQRLSEIVALYEISKTFTTTLDTATAVAEIVQLLWRRFTPQALSLSLLHPEDEQLELLAQRGEPTDPPPGERVTVAAHDEPAILRGHVELVGEDESLEPSHRARIVLRAGDHLVGILQLARGPELPGFDGDDRTMLEVCASQIAASLENARLYRQIKEQNLQTIRALVAAIDARDPYTRGHSEQVMRYSVGLAQALGFSPEQVERIKYGALLHDIGKIGIRDDVLLKPGRLTDDEFALMACHPQIGAEILRHIKSLGDVIPTIQHHHERLDGAGYPEGKVGGEISDGARIVAIADAFDAMTSDRAYRKAMSREEAFQILLKGSNIHWDGRFVTAFMEMMRQKTAPAASPDRPAQLPLAKSETLDSVIVGS